MRFSTVEFIRSNWRFLLFEQLKVGLFVFPQRDVSLEQFLKRKLYLKNSIKIIMKNCGRSVEDFFRHPHPEKQKFFWHHKAI